MNAFELLNVSKTADDTAILNAYLQQVRECPPEKDPKQFEKIRAAYEAIQDGRKRIQYELFGVEEIDTAAILHALISTEQQLPVRLTSAQLQHCIQSSLQDMTYE